MPKDDTEYTIDDVEDLLMTTEGEPTTPGRGTAPASPAAGEAPAGAASSGTAVPTLRKILFGSFLGTGTVRRQIWLVLIVMALTVLYVAFRYQNQQDIVRLSEMEKELQDAKYKALSSSSELTERSRESHVLEQLKANNDSTLRQSDQPPYIITVPEE